jgi:signal transduction histidine kinase
LNLRIDEGNRKDEIAQLAMTFNQMLQRLEEAFILQRDFVANAAHELRTPFTVMLAEVEYSLMHDRSVDQYKHVLENLTDEIKQMSNLSNGLLELARMSLDDNYFERKNVRIDELLIETCDEILRGNYAYNIKLFIDDLPEDESSLLLSGNGQLLKIAIRNIIENGCKFSDGKVVKIYLLIEERNIKIEIEDRGIGISSEDLTHIFQPFFRGKNTQFIAGYGLGLALTKKVVELHCGEIKVDTTLGVGSKFTILFPINSKL